MEKRKLTKQDIDKVRDIEGFPIGTDEDIIALSDAPYYTACPNPFIEEFIQENGHPYDEETDDYHCEPFSSDVSEGKNDPLYSVHTYHTKVPYKAIMKYILHYTKPNDIVLDGFCGTGMTGVAAKACAEGVSNLTFNSNESDDCIYGGRHAILVDLSPAATHIANRYSSGFDIKILKEEGDKLLKLLKDECGWMYETHHTVNGSIGKINYTVWSDVMICPQCGHEFVFWDVAVDRKEKLLRDKFKCPKCQAELTKRSVQIATEVIYDNRQNHTVTVPKQVPVLIYYTANNGSKYEKSPDAADLQIIDRVKKGNIPYWYPNDTIPVGDKLQEALSKGINTADYFFQKRNLYALAFLWKNASEQMRFIITAFIMRASKMNKVHIHNFLFGGGGWNAGYLTGVIYFPSLSVETSVIELLSERIKSVVKAFSSTSHEHSSIVSTQSTTDLKNIPSSSVDYIFTDPPFGDNLMYSELNYVWECWLKVKTNTKDEAIMNRTQQKKLVEYQDMMTRCFCEYNRILKPNRWMTVEFHNSKNAVWNAIQTSLQRSGFVVADVRTIDKQQVSFNQGKGASQAIKQDLIISAYKPKDSFTKEFKLKAGTDKTAWSFVRQHLSNLPIAVKKGGKLEVIAERQAFLLWDRMVAYHIMHGIAVPMDASEFYKGLDEKFLKRDNMYFLPKQVNKYDAIRATCEVENIQFSLFVQDEKTAIGWLYQQLDPQNGGEPQTYQDLMPKFMQELKAVDKREKMPELMVILEENFLKDDKGRWYIPDYTKSGDIAKLREKNLLKEFAEYQATKGKLKVFRSEAIRAGFAKLWKEKNYNAIVEMAERLPEETIQEDSNLLMYYDISLSRAQSAPTQMKMDME